MALDVSNMRKKAALHKKAAREYEKAIRLQREAFRALFNAEEWEAQANEIEKQNTIRNVNG